MTIWPFGPQMFVGSNPINSVADPQSIKLRRFPTLQWGVTSCSVTSPISANTGKPPEATEFPIPLSGSVQAHLLNLGWSRC